MTSRARAGLRIDLLVPIVVRAVVVPASYARAAALALAVVPIALPALRARLIQRPAMPTG